MWVPASESHAIENVAVTFAFSEALPLKFIKSASSYADTFITSGRFSVKKEVYESNIEINTSAPKAPSSELVGYSYAPPTDASQDVVRFQKNFAYFSALEYGTWKAFSQDAYETIGPFIIKALEITEVASIKLEYTDRFVFEGEKEEANFRDVLNVDSLGLPAVAIGNGMPWHDKKGWFEILEAGAVLINSDILATEVTHRDRPETPLKSVQIITVIETKFPESMGNFDDIKSVLEALHTKSKDTVKSVITDNAAKMVGMS